MLSTPEAKDAVVAIGFAPRHIDPKKGEQMADSSAAWHLAMAIQARVYAGLIYCKGGMAFSKESIDVDVSGDLFRAVHSRMKVLERWEDPRSWVNYVLVALPMSEAVELAEGEIKKRGAFDSGVRKFIRNSFLFQEGWSGGKPKWLRDVPKGDGYIYAVGSALSHFNPAVQIENAEKKALAELARTLRVKVQQITTTILKHSSGISVGRDVEVISRQVAEASLYGVQIVARWWDAETGEYYVLARIPVNMVKKNFAALVAETGSTRTGESVSPEDIEKMAEKAFEELERVTSSPQD